MTSNLPVLRDMDACAYYKEDAGKLLLGAFEPKAKPWGDRRHPGGLRVRRAAGGFRPFRADPGRRHASRAVVAEGRHPQVLQTGRRASPPISAMCWARRPRSRISSWPPASTPSASSQAGGVGWALAHWIAEGEPPFDLWDVDIRRFSPHHSAKSFLVPRVSEALGLLYAMHWPFRQFETSRGIRKSAFYEQERALGACFGEVAGFERPNWYAPKGVKPVYEYSYGRQNWFEYCGEECRNVRSNVGFFDQSSFAKFLVTGKDAERELQRISCRDVSRQGRATYTQWLNKKGRIEADLTVTKLAEERFLVVTAVATATRDWHYMKSNFAPGADVTVEDMSNHYAVLGVMGPNSQEADEQADRC
jgi:4-methylaminobutanoate oxidase (formaldehyde-forming)